MRQKLSEWRECKLWREGNSWILRSGVGWDGRFSVFLSPFSSFRALSCRSRTITRGVVKVYRSRRSECFQCLIRTFIDIYGPIWLAARSVKEPKWRSLNYRPQWLRSFWSVHSGQTTGRARDLSNSGHLHAMYILVSGGRALFGQHQESRRQGCT